MNKSLAVKIRKGLVAVAALVVFGFGLAASPAEAATQMDGISAGQSQGPAPQTPSEASRAETCFDRPPTIVGTPGEDVLHGTPGDDIIVGLTGNDQIFGDGGFDIICGGRGDDTISSTSNHASLDPVHDWLSGGDGHDVLLGAYGDDWLVGGTGIDRLTGGFGKDSLDGGADTDRCVGDDGFAADGVTDTATNCEVEVSIP